jgi:hypothetical protein
MLRVCGGRTRSVQLIILDDAGSSGGGGGGSFIKIKVFVKGSSRGGLDVG